MSAFVREGGTFVAPASDAAIDAAKRERARRDELYGKGVFVCRENVRWSGALAEAAFARWLRERGVGFEWFGGVDESPDFLVWRSPGDVDGLAVGVKCQVVQVDRFESAYGVVVPEQHAERNQEKALFFAAYHERLRAVRMLGMMLAPDFYAVARRREVGDPIGPRSVALNPCFQVTLAELTPASTWVERLSGAVRQAS